MSENSPVTFDHKLFWGEHKLLQFPVANGQGIDTWTLQFTIWDSKDRDNQLAQKATSNGITVLDAHGTCQVALSADDWDEMNPGTEYYYELWRVDAGSEQNLAFGGFYVR